MNGHNSEIALSFRALNMTDGACTQWLVDIFVGRPGKNRRLNRFNRGLIFWISYFRFGADLVNTENRINFHSSKIWKKKRSVSENPMVKIESKAAWRTPLSQCVGRGPFSVFVTRIYRLYFIELFSLSSLRVVPVALFWAKFSFECAAPLSTLASLWSYYAIVIWMRKLSQHCRIRHNVFPFELLRQYFYMWKVATDGVKGVCNFNLDVRTEWGPSWIATNWWWKAAILHTIIIIRIITIHNSQY